MQELSAEIRHVVANPIQFLWAPFEMAIVNIVISIAFMLLCIAVLGWTPLFALVPLIGGHAALIGAGTTNPHLTTVLRASGRYPKHRRRHNLSKVSCGVKYIP